jgi:hypothetical protein
MCAAGCDCTFSNACSDDGSDDCSHAPDRGSTQ